MSAPTIEEVHAILEASRQRIEEIARTKYGAVPLARLLARMERAVKSPPRVALLGEFNSGKSTLANALVGAEALPTSIHANTRVPLHVRFAAKPTLAVEMAGGVREAITMQSLSLLQSGRVRMLHAGVALDRLKKFELIDTPGLQPGGATSLAGAERFVLEACRRANIAIWCTAATQAWKASEAQMWRSLPDRLKSRSLLVATLADTLNTDRDRQRVEARLRAEAGPQFSAVVLVAAADVELLRRSDREAPDFAERWAACGGEALDRELQALIDKEVAARTPGVHRVLARVTERLRQAA
jgi:predicted GTPase